MVQVMQLDMQGELSSVQVATSLTHGTEGWTSSPGGKGRRWGLLQCAALPTQKVGAGVGSAGTISPNDGTSELSNLMR